MRKLREEGTTGFEVEVLFRQLLNMNQIHYITKLLKALGKYMVLDRDMLNIRTGGKIGLSFVKKAIDYSLIAEHQYKSKEEGPKKQYFLSLAPGGIYFLEAQGYLTNKLKLSADHYERSHILTYNQFLIDNNQDISTAYLQGNRSDFFFSCSPEEPRTLIHFFPYLTSEEKIMDFLRPIIEKELQGKKGEDGSEGVPEDVDVDQIIEDRFLIVPIKGAKVSVGELSFRREENDRNMELPDYC